MSKVDIVIVNWNAGPQLHECIASIFEFESEAIGSVTIVDNASRDGSAEFARIEPRVRLIEPGRNLGFGTACNLGAAEGCADYVLFLNPDTRLLRPTLRAVADFMDRPEGASTGVCSVRLIDGNGATSRHCSRLPSAATLVGVSIGLPKLLPMIFAPLELVDFDHEHDADVPHVMGAFYCIRRDLLKTLAGFDQRFFVYYEDLDLSARVRAAGCQIRYLAGEAVYHRIGGTSNGAKAKALSYLLEGRLLFARKHYSYLGYLLVAAAVYLIEPVRRVTQGLISGPPDAVREVIRAYRRLWAISRGRVVDRT